MSNHALLQGEIVDELAGLEDEDCFASGLAGIRGKAARAVIQRDMRRKQQARSAELAWQRYEVQHALTHLAHQSS